MSSSFEPKPPEPTKHDAKYRPHMKPKKAEKLEIGDWIDCRDESGRFYLAQIIEKSENTIKVHFDGFEAKYDVKFDLKKEFWRVQKPYLNSKSLLW